MDLEEAVSRRSAGRVPTAGREGTEAEERRLQDADSLWGRPPAEGGRGGGMRGGEKDAAGGRALVFWARGSGFWQDEVVCKGRMGGVVSRCGCVSGGGRSRGFCGGAPTWLILSRQDHHPQGPFDAGVTAREGRGLEPECPQVTPASPWESLPLTVWCRDSKFGLGILQVMIVINTGLIKASPTCRNQFGLHF